MVGAPSGEKLLGFELGSAVGCDGTEGSGFVDVVAGYESVDGEGGDVDKFARGIFVEGLT